MFHIPRRAHVATTSELQRYQRKLLDRVDRGDTVVLVRNNTPVAVLMPPAALGTMVEPEMRPETA